jgi:hypothetical protein
MLKSLDPKFPVNYIVYNSEFRKKPQPETKTLLLTDENPEYVTYLFNLPEHRYDRAKRYSGSLPLQLMYMDKGKYDKQVKDL